MYHYQLYGLHLGSNKPFSLLPQTQTNTVDIEITLDGAPINYQVYPFCKKDIVEIAPSRHNFVFDLVFGRERRWFQIVSGKNRECVCYTINHNASQIRAVKNPYSPYSNFQSFLLHPIIDFALRLRGVVCLHATALIIDGHAIALVGEKGSGKSTTAASIYLQGYPVLADDVAALSIDHGRFFIQAGLTRLRLSRKTAEILYSSDNHFESVWENFAPSIAEKVYLGSQNSHIAALPLTAIYFLAPRKDHLDKISIQQLRSPQNLLVLARNTPRSYILDDIGKAHELKVLAELAGKVPVKKVLRPNNIRKIFEIGKMILDDAKNIIDDLSCKSKNNG